MQSVSCVCTAAGRLPSLCMHLHPFWYLRCLRPVFRFILLIAWLDLWFYSGGKQWEKEGSFQEWGTSATTSISLINLSTDYTIAGFSFAPFPYIVNYAGIPLQTIHSFSIVSSLIWVGFKVFSHDLWSHFHLVLKKFCTIFSFLMGSIVILRHSHGFTLFVDLFCNWNAILLKRINQCIV